MGSLEDPQFKYRIKEEEQRQLYCYKPYFFSGKAFLKMSLFGKGLPQGINTDRVSYPVSCTYLLSRIYIIRTRVGIAVITVNRRNEVTKPEIQKLYIEEAFKNKGLLKTDLRGAENYKITLVRENNNRDFKDADGIYRTTVS